MAVESIACRMAIKNPTVTVDPKLITCQRCARKAHAEGLAIRKYRPGHPAAVEFKNLADAVEKLIGVKDEKI